MSKTSATTKPTQKRTYKCGACKELGHNARTCPTKGGSPTTVTAPVVEVVAEATSESSTEEAEEPDSHKASLQPSLQTQLAIDGSVDLTASRGSPSGRPAIPAAPYDCPSCNRVAVLVLVELNDGTKALRCEGCRNSSPIKTILKWGAFPKDKPKAR